MSSFDRLFVISEFSRFPISSPRGAAIKFLIETGTLMHFPDTSHGLCTLYFLCPVWLSECLQRIIHLKSSRSVARNGVICAEDLRVTRHTPPQPGAVVTWAGCFWQQRLYLFFLAFVFVEMVPLMFYVVFVQMLLVGTGFTEQTEEQYFQFLSKFEIALPVASNRCSVTKYFPTLVNICLGVCLFSTIKGLLL